MLKTKEVVVPKRKVTKLDKSFCDWCGKEFTGEIMQCNGYGTVIIGFGYGSIYDDSKWEGEICDDCFEKKFKKKLRQTRD